MIGSSGDDGDRGVYGAREPPTYRFGDDRRCELCERQRRCFDRFGMVACQPCHEDFLPPGGLL